MKSVSDMTLFEFRLEQIKNNMLSTSNDFRFGNIDNKGIIELATILQTNTSLTSLSLERDDVRDNGAQALSVALEMNKSLTALDLTNNGIGIDGVGALSSSLKINKNLSMLCLDHNKIGDDGATLLSEALAHNSSLSCLKLSACEVGNNGVTSLAKALGTNSGLSTLDLTHNDKINYFGITNLIKVLETNASLKNLCLGYINISYLGVEELTKALKMNRTLLTLKLNCCKIGSSGIKKLSEFLKINTNLSELDLYQNEIDDEGLKELAEALKVNIGLSILNLNSNNLGNEGLNYLAQALEVNCTLSDINLNYNKKVDMEGLERLAESLEFNYTLHTMAVGIDSKYMRQSKLLLERLERNRKLARCLQPLFKAINENALIDGESIESIANQIIKIIPEFSRLAVDSYPVEARRLLTGLGHMSIHSPESQIDALKCLAPPFKNTLFQEFADKKLGLLLSGDITFELEKKDLAQQGLLLKLYSLRNCLDQPEFRFIAQNAIFKLIHPENEFTIAQKMDFENIRILSQQEFYQLLTNALKACEQHENPNPNEIFLLNSLVESQECFSFTAPTACYSPAFIKAFKSFSPNAHSFTLIDHCIFSVSDNSPSYVIDLPKNTEQEVTRDQVENYSLNYINQTIVDKPLIKIIAALRENILDKFPYSEAEIALNTVQENQLELSQSSATLISNVCTDPDLIKTIEIGKVSLVFKKSKVDSHPMVLNVLYNGVQANSMFIDQRTFNRLIIAHKVNIETVIKEFSDGGVTSSQIAALIKRSQQKESTVDLPGITASFFKQKPPSQWKEYPQNALAKIPQYAGHDVRFFIFPAHGNSPQQKNQFLDHLKGHGLSAELKTTQNNNSSIVVDLTASSFRG